MPTVISDPKLIKRAKLAAAKAAVKHVRDDMILGVGTGSTVNLFIAALAASPICVQGAVPSSQATRKKLEENDIPVIAPQKVSSLPLYVDGADQINRDFEMIKGGGGALTGEKILAQMSSRMICIADENKFVREFDFPLPLEILSIAYSMVCEEITKLGGRPVLRKDFVSDYGNIVIDVHDFRIWRAKRLEVVLNEIPGIVSNGLFSIRPADMLLLGLSSGKVSTLYSH
ncbi:MAG: ribose-5-phosphate isomerase RpiA [Proteobacteria bacterium]|nr:ribose-5-phosphate isomerase RpiA [Pseudomonadota bacterium]